MEKVCLILLAHAHTHTLTHTSFDICICHQNFIPDKTSALFRVWTQCHELKTTTISIFTNMKTPNYVYVTSHLNISLLQLVPGLNKCTREFEKFLWQKLTLHNMAITKTIYQTSQKFFWQCGGDSRGCSFLKYDFRSRYSESCCTT